MKPRRFPSPATVIATVALIVALSGTAYAVTKIGTKQIKNRAVTEKKLANSVGTVRAWGSFGSTGTLLEGTSKGVKSIGVGASNASSTVYCVDLARKPRSAMATNTITDTYSSSALTGKALALTNCSDSTDLAINVVGNVNDPATNVFLVVTFWAV